MTDHRLKVTQFALLGGLLGCGAPLGYIVYSYAFLNDDGLGLLAWAVYLWHSQTAVIAYMAIPTIVIFSGFGCFAGRAMDRIATREQQMKELLSVAAHDIRSPAAVMTTAVDFLREEITDKINEDQIELLDMINRQTTVIAELVTEILDIRRFEESQGRLDLESVDLIELLERAIQETEILVKNRQGRVELVIASASPLYVIGDSIRLRQVFRNLIGNASKYMNTGTVLEISVEPGGESAVKITITNEGPLIPPEKVATIFDKFVQSRIRDHKLGHGLGLTICKHVIDEHGGRIWAENVSDKGVRMHIELPHPTSKS